MQTQKKDLTVSQIDRQNILNNPYALQEIERATKIKGILFEGRTVVLKEQVAKFFDVTLRTIENYLEKYEAELSKNGYVILRGERLKTLKKILMEGDVHEIDFGNINKTPQLGIFDFRAFLNLAMLISESQTAKDLRQLMLDVVISTISNRIGDNKKYVNQRDEDFISSWFEEENYRKQFTEALRDFIDMGNFKYAIYTDKIYVAIFREKAGEYRKILKLKASESVREAFYSEILDLIASFELGFAEALKEKFNQKKRQLISNWEADEIFEKFSTQIHLKPLIEKARNKMASRDLAFRDALHLQLKEYLTPLKQDEFERFLGEKSQELHERIDEAKDLMKRLKDK